MCGITGFYAFNEIGRLFGINLGNANNKMTHRGPDLSYLFNENRMGFGHRRLSILDLSMDGRQPMTDRSGRYTICFNGEIFNYQILKNELINKGIVFNSETDTEILLYLYIHEKEKCLERLNGFFAFAIYDQQEDSLFMARDRFGIKPFLYYLDEDKFLFASELSALKGFNLSPKVDLTALYQYFQFHYVPAPQTIFQNVFKLLPAHFMTLKGRDLKIEKYYEVPSEIQPISYQNAQTQLVSLLDNAVQKRLISDVPLGTFLSGGIDSSVITALASKYTTNLQTFSIGYKNNSFFDETPYAEAVAKKFRTQHTVFKLTNDDLFEAIFELLPFLGEPFADSSAIPFYILSQRTRKKITVALSGDGADELFAGYNKYLGEFKVRQGGFLANILKNNLGLLEKLPRSRNSFLTNKFRQFHRFSESANKSAQERYWYLSTFINEKQAKSIFTPEIQARIDFEKYNSFKNGILSTIQEKDLNEILQKDVQTLLSNDMLHKVDMASMANSLEVRVPFLDHHLVEFAFSLSSDYKINHRMKKRILQDAFRYILPKELYKRPKKGFDVPLMQGFQTVLREKIENDWLNDERIASEGIFDLKYIQSLKSTIFNRGSYDQNHVWALLVFQDWHTRFQPDFSPSMTE